MSDAQDRFDRQLEIWGSRPPSTTPAVASRRVLAALPEEGSGQWTSVRVVRWATAMATLVLLLVVSWAVRPDPTGTPVADSDLALPPLAGDVLLLWLDDETPLYLTVAPPAMKGDPR